MSQFRSFFQKQDNTKNLQYDNVAFLHYSTTLVFIAIIVTLILIIRDIFFNKNFQLIARVLNNPLFKKQISNQKKLKNKYYKSKNFLIKFVLLILFSVIGYCCLQTILLQQNKFKGFDPYQLLGVQYDAPIRKIKKRYRTLALLLHPDKNPGNPQVATQFILISKAYQCLTNIQLKDNCLKYGNPEGQQAFNVGIALPSFLLNKENQIFVLIFEFIVLLILIPILFIDWNNRLQIRDQRGILVSNYKLLYKYVKKRLTKNKMMLMIGQMKQVQYQHLKDQYDFISVKQKNNKSHQKEKQGLHVKVKKNKIKKQIKVTASAINNIKRIVNYMSKKQQNTIIIKKMPQLLKSIVYFSLDFCTSSKKRKLTLFPNKKNKPILFIGTSQLDKIISWSQIFYQATSKYSSNGLESLSLSEDELQKLNNKYFLKDLIKSQQKREQFLNEIHPKKRKLIVEQIQSFPNLEMSVQILLQGQQIQFITQRDTIMIRIILNKINPNHCISYLKSYPFLKQQKFYLTIQNNDNLMYFQELIFVPNQNKIVVEYTCKHSFESQQQTQFLIKIRSDCYFGLDLQKYIKMGFKEYQGEDNIIFHKDDETIQKQKKGIFEAMFSMRKYGDNSDDQFSDSQQKKRNEIIKKNKNRLNEEIEENQQQENI